MARIFRRKKEAKKEDAATEGKIGDLEHLTRSDAETYQALTSTMFLDPRKIETSMKQAIENAKRSEKDGDLPRAGMWYEVAGGLAIYEGNVKKVIENYTDAGRVTGRKYAILKNPEKAVAVAKEYYEKHLTS